MPQKILQDQTLDKKLLKEGYIVVPFLNPDEVSRLITFFYDNHPSGIPGFYASAHVQDIAFRNRMNDEIKKGFMRAIDSYFHECTPLGGSFVVKSSEQKERLHPHQDWNIVDEEKHRSFNIWVPLVDLIETNGVIRVLKGSHNWLTNYRGPGIDDGFAKFHDKIWTRMKPLYMKAGEALIYDHRLFHASDPNVTNDLRIAAVFGIISKGIPMYHYIGNKGKVEMYNSNLDFFLKEDIQRGEAVLKKVSTLTLPRPVTKLKFDWFLTKNRIAELFA